MPSDHEIYLHHELGAGYMNRSTTQFQTLGVKSRFEPYLFLVDSKGLIRWQSDGTPSDEDIQCLYLIFSSNLC